MKRNWKTFLIAIAIPLAVGGLSTLLSGGMKDYFDLQQPPLSPPGWVFPIVWSILYVMMGYASYRIYTSGASEHSVRRALILYGIQLFLNFLWPIFFFGFHWYLAAFVLLLVLWGFVFWTMGTFSAIDKTAGYLLVPYLIWLSFAAYLNLGVVFLN